MVFFGHVKILCWLNVYELLVSTELTSDSFLLLADVPNGRSILSLARIWRMRRLPKLQYIFVAGLRGIIFHKDGFREVLNVLIRWINAISTRISNQTTFTDFIEGWLRVPKSSQSDDGNFVGRITWLQGDFGTFAGGVEMTSKSPTSNRYRRKAVGENA